MDFFNHLYRVVERDDLGKKLVVFSCRGQPVNPKPFASHLTNPRDVMDATPALPVESFRCAFIINKKGKHGQQRTYCRLGRNAVLEERRA